MLEKRWIGAHTACFSNGFQAEFDAITSYPWNLTVAVPAQVALNIVTDPNFQCVGYESLVGAGARKHAEFADDSQRKAVASVMFGSFGEKIVYGALSLSDRGLGTYGDVICQLKKQAVAKRTSFLEVNSYEFVKFGSDLPLGYRSNWENRGKLAAIKLHESNLIHSGQLPEEWDAVLLKSDGKNRNLDEFVEGHIYGPFNLYSIEKMTPANKNLGSSKKLVEMVLEAFDNLEGES